MKILFRIFLSVLFIFVCIFQVRAWDGMPTPPLHVEGNKLKDPTGKDVLLHGWMQPTESWFNGEGHQYSNPTDWTNPDNVAGMLNFLKEEATVMSDTSPRYGQDHGWYASFVRVNTDAVGGWTSESGLVDTVQFDAWINNFLVPYVEHLESRGLYLILCATGPMVVNVNDDGVRNASIGTQSRMLTFWNRVANAPGIKNANNIMFELMNEPVQVESSPGNGKWGSGRGTYFEAFRDWTQPIIDTIRNTGADNVIWVPTLGWQGEPHGWAQYPFTGTNIGVAAHYYPAYGGVHNSASSVQNLWNSNYKPAADRWPMVITEMMWFPNEPGGYDDLFNGTTAGFGNAIKKAMDKQGNVSFLIGFIGDHLANLTTTKPQNCPLGSHEGTQSYFEWLPTYTWAAPDDGTPVFEYAVVDDENPKQIKIHVKHAIKKDDTFNGFSVAVDNQSFGIDSVAVGDTTNVLNVNLSDSLLSGNEIKISYEDGNVFSVFEKALINFDDTLVFNLLEGASPVLTNLQTNKSGDTLKASFSKKMLTPDDVTLLKLEAAYKDNGGEEISFTQSSVCSHDSTTLCFALGEQVFAEHELLLSYSGNSIVSSDSSHLEIFSNVPVLNNAQGLPVQIDAGRLEADGFSVVLEFSKSLDIAVGQSKQFVFNVNGENMAIKDFYISDSTIRFSPIKTIHHGDELLVSYTPGNITAIDHGPLDTIKDYSITNLVKEPVWHNIPGKIEAEVYALQSGTDIEQTGDEGGGQNVGWIDSGDWLDYAINNTSENNIFEITFRVAAPNDDCELEYYLDNTKLGSISVPNTGNWQVWQSVTIEDVDIEKGKHYLKLVAVSGGFNINYLNIEQSGTGIDKILESQILTYPNPASEYMTIRTTGFEFNKVEIFDMAGKKVFQNLFDYKKDLQMPVSLLDGVYVLKISNEVESVFRKIVIENR